MNIAQVLSFLIIVALKEFSIANIETYLKVGDWIFQISLIAIVLYLSYAILIKFRVTYLRQLWPIPVLFCLSLVTESFVLNSLFTDSVFTGRPGLDGKSYAMVFYENSRYMNVIMFSVTFLASLWVLYRNKDQQIRIA